MIRWLIAIVLTGIGGPLVLAAEPAIGTSVATQPYHAWAQTPPMGWNSWDCFGTQVTEEEVRANAAYIERFLKPYGWDIVTIDIQWYEPKARGFNYRKGAVLEMDGNGRLLP